MKVEDIRPIVTQGRVEPNAVIPELRKLAASDQWQEREVAATALVEIGKREQAAVLREAHRWAKSRDSNVRRAATEGLRGVVKRIRKPSGRCSAPPTRWIVKDGLRKLKASRPGEVAAILGSVENSA